MTNVKNRASHTIFHKRNFLDYFAMNLASGSAGQVANVTVIWVVFEVTQSALDVAVVGVAQTIATVLVTLPAGVWVDRYDRRKLLLLANMVRTASLVLLIIFTVGHGFQLVAITAIVFIWNAATEIYRSTDHSVLPDLVGADEITDANGLTQAGYQLIGSASSVLGGALVAFAGAAIAFLYGALGYALAAIFSAFLFYRLRSPVNQKNEPRKRRVMTAEIKEGFQWLVTQKGLFQLSVSAVAFNFLNIMPFYFLVIYVNLALKAGALLFGGILAAFVIGSAIGSVLVGQTNALAHSGKVWILLYGGTSGVVILLLGLFPDPLLAISANFVLGLTSGFTGNVWLTSAQNLVPSPMRGRYFAIDGLLSFIGGPPAIAIGGVLVSLIGILPLYEVSGAILMAFAFFFSLMKSLWKLDGRIVEGSGVV